MNIESFKRISNITEKEQYFISNLFTKETNDIPELKEFRDLVEKEVYGFGERAFLSMHKMLVESFAETKLKFLEIGVYKGQIPALIRILEKLCNKEIEVYGITPLNTSDGHIESDYAKNIKDLHDLFHLKYPNIIKGYSQDKEIVEQAKQLSPFDILLIDGHHAYEMVKQDLENYTPMVSVGGYLVVDDSANFISGTYWGAFWGIESVSKAVDETLPPKTKNENFEYVGNVIHNRIWKRIK